MRVLHVCSELYPLLKTGGLADVVGALPNAQIAAGADVRLLLPGFPTLFQGMGDTDIITELETFAGTVTLRYATYNRIGVYLIDAPHLYDRVGSPYHDDFLNAYGDNHLRFALLGWIAAELACGLDFYWRPEVVHAHDWHAGLACAYLADRGYPAKTVFTIHNLAYQGLFSMRHRDELYLTYLPGIEFYGQLSYLKAGLYYANHVTAVSPNYADEITYADYGFGMEGILLARQLQGQLSGILNGVDYTIWNPAKDKQIPHTYSVKRMAGKAKNKAELQKKLGLKVDDKVPLFVVVSRLSHQKGLDLLLDALPALLGQGAQLALLGSGDISLQDAFSFVAKKHPKQIAVKIGYDEDLSHQLIAAGDVILIPSRFEPCGLTQLYALKYGTLPLVRCTGGLADTVIDCSLENLADGSASGFVFNDSHVFDLNRAIRRVFALWNQPELWKKVQSQAMSLDFSWKVSAKAYLSLYKHL